MSASLEEQVSAALKQAMLAKDAVRLQTLRLLKAAFGYAQIEQKTDRLGDADALAVIRREAKKRRDSIEQYTSAQRGDLAASERAELAILEAFLPAALSEAEVESLVRGVIAELGASTRRDLGAVMQAALARAGGRADGRAVSGAAARLLA